MAGSFHRGFPPASTDSSALALRRRLQDTHGLWVDPYTADYLVEASGTTGAGEVEFIAADARTGRSAFRTLPASALRAAGAAL